jgi:hypothetical protein
LEETITAICIDDTIGLTKGKGYQVKQSKEYDNYYELTNDKGEVDTYKKERFEMVVQQIGTDEGSNARFCESGNVIATINGAEGEKMEEKTMKVRCIQKCMEDLEGLTIGKEYPVLEECIDYYLISNSNNAWYSKKLFEKVEDVLIVECIWSDGTVTPNAKYPVIEEYKETYLIKNDLGEEREYYKTDFKPVEPQKEVEELEFRKVISIMKPNEEYICQDNYIIRCHDNGRIEFEAPSGNKIWFDVDDKFIKIEPKPVTTAEAFKALDEGKIIKSVFSGDEYKMYNEVDDMLLVKNLGAKTFDYAINISADEFIGQWIIIEGEE